MQCVILAGGLGTRMRPWTTHIPKTLIPVRGEPFAHHQLAWLTTHGVTDVVYSIGDKGGLVRDFVGDGRKWGLSVNYVEDGKELAGTAGALRRVLDAGLLRDRFLVLYGDSFLPFDYRLLGAAFHAQRRPAMMAVYRNENRFDTGNVRFSDGVVQLYRKAKPGERFDPSLDFIDYGISVLTPAVIEKTVPPAMKADLADVYHRLSVEERLAGYEVTQRFYEIGSPAGLADLEAWIDAQPFSFRETQASECHPMSKHPGTALRVKVFADGASLDSMRQLAEDGLVKGFTTNPTLMRQSGVKDYGAFSREVLKAIPHKPISFEVIADSVEDIRRQALEIASWGDNVYVKIPITTTDGLPLHTLIHDLSHRGVKVNVTAVFTLEQVAACCGALKGGAPSVISIFAGRIADAGKDPAPIMRAALAMCRAAESNIELLWASPREIFNVVQADEIGVDIITVTEAIRTKLHLIGKSLDDFSRETVQMFKRDADSAGYTL